MKKILNIFCLTFIFFSCFSQELNESTFKRWIKKCDVKYCVEGARNAPSFWMSMYKNEKNRQVWEKKNGTSTFEEVFKSLNAISINDAKNYWRPNVIKEEEALRWSDRLTYRLLGGFAYGDCLITIVQNPELNASTYPNGLIFMNSGLVDLLTEDEQLAILAHEYAHYLLNHSYLSSYRNKKKDKRNKIWTDLTVGLLAASEAYYNYSSGSQVLKSDYGAWHDAIYEDLSYDTYVHSFKFSREQELQSDLTAFRFLQTIGVDARNLINAFIKLRNKTGSFYSDFSDHPSLDFRIGVLYYLLLNEK